MEWEGAGQPGTRALAPGRTGSEEVGGMEAVVLAAGTEEKQPECREVAG